MPTFKVYCKMCGKQTPNKRPYCSDKCKDADPNKVPCKLCGEEFATNRAQGIHLTKTHGMDKIEYVIKFILNGVVPECQCGCGEKVSVKFYEPYIVSKFISGHNSNGENNSRFGVIITQETRDKQSAAATERINKYKERGEVLPMHTEEVMAKRSTRSIK